MPSRHPDSLCSISGSELSAPSGALDGREVADLGQRDEPLVGGRLPRGAVEQVGVLRGRQAAQLEGLEPPEAQPARDHRVEAAHRPLLGEAVLAGAEGEVVLARLPDGRHRDGHPPHQRGQRRRGELLRQLVRHRVPVRGRAPGEVDVHDRAVRAVGLAHDLRRRRQGVRQIRALGQGRHQAHPPLVAAVVEGGDELAPAARDPLDVPEVADLVVAPRQDLEHRLVLGDPAREPLAQEPHQRLGAGDDRLDEIGAVRSRRTPGQAVELLAHAPVDALAGRRDQGAVERGEARAAGELADRRVPELRRGHEPVEGLPQLLAQRGRQGAGVAQPPVEEPGHGRELRRHALLREEDPVGGLGQLVAARQVVHAVVAERARERGAHGLGHPLPVGVE